MDVQQEIMVYLTLTFVIGWGLQFIGVASQDTSSQSILILLAAAVPGIFALCFMLYYRDLPILANLTGWIQPPLYYLVLGIPAILLVATRLLTDLPINWQYIILFPILLLLAYIEEVGWRGYLQRRVIDEYSLVSVGSAIGVIWAVYHLPDFLIQFSGTAMLLFLVSILVNIGLSLIMVFLQIKTRSLPLIALLHTSSNLFNSLISPADGVLSMEYVLVRFVYGIIVVILGLGLVIGFLDSDE